ncbi:CHAT domain-containing protein [Leptospira sp. GIMC2001]|uniref:CHAT domain-containing protein n=1 Tax=Leptospira sp. GIMC2001 TaxID=1513297 RepID=UPI00234926A8|nr:CHAT domain-containing protein [Leptospira sp. GIMC2001]WCL48414.1 CHAT domain-containing protein [Leptospira sp. GIMC2001]
MINLIIDRVGNVNVFNVLDGNTPSGESHLQSVIDDDLIMEFNSEIENLFRVSNALQNTSNKKAVLNTDILNELKVLGETFFYQFFPKEIVERLKLATDKSIHFNIDPKLASIPWELFHDGNCFLADKFRIGKTIRGGFHTKPDPGKEKLKMLIIADPTEDLVWAQKEGEELFRILTEKVSPSRLELEFIGGKQVNKLKLLSLIKDKNIIHYCGHLIFSDDPLENGWLLSGGKILKSREIKNSGISTDIVFSNSCVSSKSVQGKINTNIMNNFAGSFLMSGIKTFIGTNWEILDNENTLDFTIRFYTYLFSDKTIGESLFMTREYARRNYDTSDLTWANYSLYGNPDFTILQDPEEDPSTQKIINPSFIMNFYPTPIANSYQRFMNSQRENLTLQEQLVYLIRCFEEFSKVLGTIIFSDHKFHSLGKIFPENPDDSISISKWWDLIYACLWDFRKLKITPHLESVIDVLNSNREVIQKILNWTTLYQEGKIDKDSWESYLITYQYFYENLLVELEEFEKINIFLVSENSNHHYIFRGVRPESSLITAPMVKQDYVGQQIEKYRGNLVVLNEKKKILIPLFANIIDNQEKGELELSYPGFGNLDLGSSGLLAK